MKLPVALTIAGSDSGGGAGIQADLKTFAVLGCHGTCAITAITAQNTVGVHQVMEMPVHLIRSQIDSVVTDLNPAAAKTGMLSSSPIIECVAGAVRAHRLDRLVVDPVMVAKGGAKLLRDDAIESMRTRLIPLAMVITPNIPEAEVLLARTIRTIEDRREAARELVRLGARCAVVKGGHADGDATDVFSDGTHIVDLPAPHRIDTRNTHGSGCTFSAAITAGLAAGLEPLRAVRAAKAFIQGAIESAIEVGEGHGPVNPMHAISKVV